jgi:hypothetical protein
MPLGTPRSLDLTGRRSGRLIAVRKQTVDASGNAYWLCKCDCGTETTVRATLINKGIANSCGCYASELTRANKRKHGWYGTPEYNAWNCLKGRCNRPNDKAYHNYGGRGIAICERWRSFENFLADMGRRPSVRHSLDRINNDGHYEPANCRWATMAQQKANTRRSIRR